MYYTAPMNKGDSGEQRMKPFLCAQLWDLHGNELGKKGPVRYGVKDKALRRVEDMAHIAIMA